MLEAAVILLKGFFVLFFCFSPLQLSCLCCLCVFCWSALSSRGVLQPRRWPYGSESVGCGGPEWLTLTSNPLAVAAGFAKQVSWALCPKDPTCVSVICPCGEIPCTWGWASPHYPIHSWDKVAWYFTRLACSASKCKYKYIIFLVIATFKLVNVNVNAPRIYHLLVQWNCGELLHVCIYFNLLYKLRTPAFMQIIPKLS